MEPPYYVKDGELWFFDGMVHYRIAIFEPDVPKTFQDRIAYTLTENLPCGV